MGMITTLGQTSDRVWITLPRKPGLRQFTIDGVSCAGRNVSVALSVAKRVIYVGRTCPVESVPSWLSPGSSRWLRPYLCRQLRFVLCSQLRLVSGKLLVIENGPAPVPVPAPDQCLCQ